MIDSDKPSIVPRLEGPKTVQPGPVEIALTAREAAVSKGSRHRLFQQQATISEARHRMSSLTELRKATRYRWSSVAVIRWLGADEELRQAFALVRDISTCGVYVESTAALAHPPVVV